MGATKRIEASQIKTIYALGASAGILERGTKDDNLHALVNRLTGQSSVSALTEAQGKTVIVELSKMKKASSMPQTREPETAPGGMTRGQQSKVWKLMYCLANCSPSEAAVGERLCGVIRREFKVDTTPANPFRWLNYRQGTQLIEALKKYIAHASCKEKDGGENAGDQGNDETAPAGGSAG